MTPSNPGTYCNRFWVQLVEDGTVKIIFGEVIRKADVWHEAVVLSSSNAFALADHINKLRADPAAPADPTGGNVVPIK